MHLSAQGSSRPPDDHDNRSMSLPQLFPFHLPPTAIQPQQHSLLQQTEIIWQLLWSAAQNQR